MVVADGSGPGPASSGPDDPDTVKIIITVSCDPQTAAQLEESVKQRVQEDTQVGGPLHPSTQHNHIQHLQEPLSTLKAQEDAGGESLTRIPVITFDSPEEEVREEGGGGSEEKPGLPDMSRRSEDFRLCREAGSECPDPDRAHAGLTEDSTASPQPGVQLRSDADSTDVHPRALLRLPPALGRYGPGGRTHIRGLSMDSGKDAVLLSHHSHHTVRRHFCFPHWNHPSG